MSRLTITSLILLSMTVVGAGIAPGAVDDPELLANANQALEGRSASIELVSGEVVKRAVTVVLGPERTSWTVGGERRDVATDDVQRISLEKRSRVKKWAKRGAVAGAIVGGLGLGHSDVDGFFAKASIGDAAAGAAGGSAIGAGAAALIKARVVYEAPAQAR